MYNHVSLSITPGQDAGFPTIFLGISETLLSYRAMPKHLARVGQKELKPLEEGCLPIYSSSAIKSNLSALTCVPYLEWLFGPPLNGLASQPQI